MPTLTGREWLWIAGMYLIVWASGRLLLAIIRLWRGPSKIDLLIATNVITRWIMKTNMDQRVRIRYITIYANGRVESQVSKSVLVAEQTP